MNILNKSMADQTNFGVRVSVDFRVQTQPTEHRGNFPSDQGWACERARRWLQKILLNRYLENKLPKDVELVFVDDDEYDPRIRAEPFEEEWFLSSGRLFDSFIHMGQGDYSVRNVAIVMARLKEAFSCLCGLQQGIDGEEAEIANRDIENVAKDVVMALTGKECVFIEPKGGEMDIKIGMDGHVESECEPDNLDLYPEGNYIIATGSLISGYKMYGIFRTMRQAVEWAQARQPLLGWASVMEVQSPDCCSVRVNP